jgi:hypothetical protein
MSPALKKLKQQNPRYIKAIFALLLVIILALPPLANFFVFKANAAALTNYKVLINNSQASATGVTYTFNWTTVNSTAIKQIDIQICTTASGTCNAPSGFLAGNDPVLASDNISGSGRTVSSPTDNAFRIVVGTPATQTPLNMYLNFTGVVNPSTTNSSFFARTTTYSDTGTTAIDGESIAAFAILTASSIAVSATVDPSFSFSVAAVNSGGNFNGGTGNIDETSTATTIPFGTLTIGTDEIVAHDLTVSTNASNGYQVTASHSANLIAGNPPLASGSANIDAFTGTNASPSNWSEPAGTTANTNTGFFGYSTEDSTLCTGTANRFTNSGPNWAGSSTVGGELVCSATPITNETTRVGWAVEVNGYQPPGLYTGTVMLIATPTF